MVVTKVTDLDSVVVTEALRLPRWRRLDCHHQLPEVMTEVRSIQMTELADLDSVEMTEALRLPRRQRSDCHRQLSEVMTEVRSTEVTAVADTDSVKVTELEPPVAGGSDASTAVCAADGSGAVLTEVAEAADAKTSTATASCRR